MDVAGLCLIVLFENRVTQHPNFIQRIVLFSFHRSAAMNEKPVHDHDQIVKDKRFEGEQSLIVPPSRPRSRP